MAGRHGGHLIGEHPKGRWRLAECRVDCANTSRVDAFLSNLCSTTIKVMRIAKTSLY